MLNDISKIIIYGKKSLDKVSYISMGFDNSISEIIKYKNITKIFTDDITKINFTDYMSHTLIILLNDKNINLIPFTINNKYIITEYTDDDYFNYHLNKNKNFLYISEYNNNYDLSEYEKILDYTYIKNRHLIIPWASIYTSQMIVNNLNNFVPIDNRINFLYIGEYNNLNILNKIKKLVKRTISQQIIKENKEIKKIKGILSYRNNDDTIDFMLLTRMSYITFGITNSTLTNNLLNNKLCFINNEDNINNDIETYFSTKTKKVDLYEIIELICKYHTFSNRLNTILKFFD